MANIEHYTQRSICTYIVIFIYSGCSTVGQKPSRQKVKRQGRHGLHSNHVNFGEYCIVSFIVMRHLLIYKCIFFLFFFYKILISLYWNNLFLSKLLTQFIDEYINMIQLSLKKTFFPRFDSNSDYLDIETTPAL